MANTGGIRAGRAFVELGTKDDAFLKGLRRAQQRLQAFGAGLQGLGLKITAASGALLAPLLASVKSFMTVGDQLDKMARRTGISAEALSELGFAAEQSGADLETLETGVRVMQRTINDAERGLSTAVEGLTDLGLAASDLRRLTPEQQFKLLAERISAVADPSKQAALAMQLLGRSGTRLLPLMQNGARGIEELQQQARQLGLTVSTQTAKDAALLTDTLNILWRSIRRVAVEIGAALGPTLVNIAGTVTRVVVQFRSWIEQHSALLVAGLKIGAAVAAVGATLVGFGVAAQAAGFVLGGLAAILTTAMGAFSGLMSVITGALAALLSPIGLTVAAVAGLAAAILTSTSAGARAIEWLGSVFNWLRSGVLEVVGGIADALAAGDIALAAKVLWAGLRVAWETGTKPLQEAWANFSYAFQRLATEAFAGIQQAWINVRSWFETNFPQTTAYIATTWANMTGTLRSVWARFQSWLTDRWLEIMGLFDDGIDVAAAQQIGQSELTDRLRQIEQDRQAQVAEAQRRAGRSGAEIEEERNAALAAVDQQKADAVEALRRGRDEQIAAAAGELDSAKAELAEARRVAGERAAGAGLAGLPGRPELGADWGAIGAAVASGTSRTFGTFSAIEAEALGPSDVVQRLIKVEEEQRDLLKRLLNAEAARAAWQ